MMPAAPEHIELQAVPEAHSSTADLTKNAAGMEPEPAKEQMPTPSRHVYPVLSPLRAVAINVTIAGITFVCSMTTGCLATGIPDIAEKLNIPDGLILWPAAIYSLTSGCTFILAGAIADVVGSRKVYLFGCALLVLTVLACGFARDGLELIIYRAFQGVAASCCLPTAISLLSQTFAPGRARTRGLAIQGASYPLGYSAGLFLGGLFVDTIGWRWGWYLTAIFTTIVFVAGIWAVPKDMTVRDQFWRRMRTQIDWVGAILVSGCLGLVSYVLAMVSSSTDNIKQPTNIALLVVGSLLAPVSYFWMYQQEKSGKTALIPTSVWPNRYFTTICAMLFLSSVTLNSLEFFFSLYLQKVQNLSALQAALRFLPEIVIGAANSFGTDAVLHKVSTYHFVMVLSIGSMIAPLLMGLMHPEWSYWYMAFWAMVLLPIAADVLFIVGAVIITDTFPNEKQALAGSIFNTVYQFGSAVGIGVMAVASAVVIEDSSWQDKTAPLALLEGYRTTFWACLGAAVVYCGIGGYGLKGIGKVGLKSE